MKPVLSDVIFSSQYATDGIVVLMLSKSSDSELFSCALDNTPYAFSIRKGGLNKAQVTEWFNRLQDKDFNGLDFYEFTVHELTDGAHEAIVTKGGHQAKFIRRASNKSRSDVLSEVKAQFVGASTKMQFA